MLYKCQPHVCQLRHVTNNTYATMARHLWHACYYWHLSLMIHISIPKCMLIMKHVSFTTHVHCNKMSILTHMPKLKSILICHIDDFHMHIDSDMCANSDTCWFRHVHWHVFIPTHAETNTHQFWNTPVVTCPFRNMSILTYMLILTCMSTLIWHIYSATCWHVPILAHIDSDMHVDSDPYWLTHMSLWHIHRFWHIFQLLDVCQCDNPA